MWAASLSLTAKQTDFQWPLRKIDLHLMELIGHNKLHLTQKTENSASGKAEREGIIVGGMVSKDLLPVGYNIPAERGLRL